MLYFKTQIYESNDGSYRIGEVSEIPQSKEDILQGLEYMAESLHIFGEEKLPEGLEDIRPKLKLRDGETEPALIVARLDWRDEITEYFGLIPASDGEWYYDCQIIRHWRDENLWICSELGSEPTTLDEYKKLQNGRDYWILGEDDLPEDIEDIRGKVEDEPDIIFAVKEEDESINYFGMVEIV